MSVDASERAGGGGRLRRPHEVEIPGDCAGWEVMYPYRAVFGADRGEVDAQRFWFHDGMHFPEPLYPFDEVVAGCLLVGLAQRAGFETCSACTVAGRAGGFSAVFEFSGTADHVTGRERFVSSTGGLAGLRGGGTFEAGPNGNA